MWIKNITKKIFFFTFYEPNLTEILSFCEFGPVSTYQRFSAAFYPKVHLFENSLLKILAQLQLEPRALVGGGGVEYVVRVPYPVNYRTTGGERGESEDQQQRNLTIPLGLAPCCLSFS